MPIPVGLGAEAEEAALDHIKGMRSLLPHCGLDGAGRVAAELSKLQAAFAAAAEAPAEALQEAAGPSDAPQAESRSAPPESSAAPAERAAPKKPEYGKLFASGGLYGKADKRTALEIAELCKMEAVPPWCSVALLDEMDARAGADDAVAIDEALLSSLAK